jgi:hypothetical protein
LEKANNQSDKSKDEEKRNREMTEGKNPKEVAEIYSKGDQYYCAECHSELPVHQSCPGCHKEIDWDRVFIETRR